MATKSARIDWVLAILLVILIVISVFGVYVVTDKLSVISSNQDELISKQNELLSKQNELLAGQSENYAKLLQAISSLNITGGFGVIASGAPTTGTVPLTVSFAATSARFGQETGFGLFSWGVYGYMH